MFIDFKYYAPKFRQLVMHVDDMGQNGCNLVEELNQDPEVEHVIICGMNFPEHILGPLNLKVSTQVKALSLFIDEISTIEAKFLAEQLKGSNITYLRLYRCHIWPEGVKYLAEILKDTFLTYLEVSYIYLTNEGIKYLTEGLKNTCVISLNVTDAITEIGGIQYLVDVLKDTRIIYLSIGRNFKFDDGGIHYLADHLKNTRLISLDLGNSNIGPDGIKYLADVLKDTCITELDISYNNLGEDGVKYLAERLKHTRIYSLAVKSTNIGIEGMKYLADILQDTCITDIDFSCNNLGDDGIKYLAEKLKNTTILNLLVAWNGIGTDGIKCLTSVLTETNITFLDLTEHYRSERIWDEEVQNLAQNLQGTCITDLDLTGNKFSDDGIRFLAHALKYTHIIQLNWETETETEMDEYFESEMNLATSKNNAISRKIQETFQKLVSENMQDGNLELILPNEIENVDIDEYLYFIKTIYDCPNVKGYIFNMVRKQKWGTYPNIIRKINEFVIKISEIFNNFFNNNITDLMELLHNCNYTDLVHQCEDMELHDIVKNLLLHRVLFYIDDDKEILHPYIYKMLNKYGMTVLNEQFDPNKKDQIISYFQSHSEIDGAEEIIELLGSYSLHD